MTFNASTISQKLELLNHEIGSAKDNAKSPVHNWYKFTAGFSHEFVNEIIDLEQTLHLSELSIFDPFAGCGTTLVSCQKKQVKAVGNEAQEFMYGVIQAKLGWKISPADFSESLHSIKVSHNRRFKRYNLEKAAHPLLMSLYTKENLTSAYLIKEAIQNLPSKKERLFFNLALSQTLHKVCIHPIAVPYIVRSKFLKSEFSCFDKFVEIATKMNEDCKPLRGLKQTSKIYNKDSRVPNREISKGSANLCITSPPYLNNLDYGEVSKVHSHFFDITSNWGDITKKVRRNLVTGATTHYKEAEFSLDELTQSEFALKNKLVFDRIKKLAGSINERARIKKGKKSFDILAFMYFKDMYEVLKEIRRVLSTNGRAYLILGDSAPYGINIPTTEILGELALTCGFNQYKITQLRTRGGKWKSLRHRHSLELTENVLILV
jgi:DNA modification methylase